MRGADTTARIWDVYGARRTRDFMDRRPGRIYGIAVDHDRRLLVSAARRRTGERVRRRVRVPLCVTSSRTSRTGLGRCVDDWTTTGWPPRAGTARCGSGGVATVGELPVRSEHRDQVLGRGLSPPTAGRWCSRRRGHHRATPGRRDRPPRPRAPRPHPTGPRRRLQPLARAAARLGGRRRTRYAGRRRRRGAADTEPGTAARSGTSCSSQPGVSWPRPVRTARFGCGT